MGWRSFQIITFFLAFSVCFYTNAMCLNTQTDTLWSVTHPQEQSPAAPSESYDDEEWKQACHLRNTHTHANMHQNECKEKGFTGEGNGKRQWQDWKGLWTPDVGVFVQIIGLKKNIFGAWGLYFHAECEYHAVEKRLFHILDRGQCYQTFAPPMNASSNYSGRVEVTNGNILACQHQRLFTKQIQIIKTTVLKRYGKISLISWASWVVAPLSSQMRR